MGQNDMLGDRKPKPGASRIPASALYRHGRSARKDAAVLGGNAGPKVPDVEFNATYFRRAPRMTFFPDAAYFNAFSIRFENIWWMASRSSLPLETEFSTISSNIMRARHLAEALQRILQQFFDSRCTSNLCSPDSTRAEIQQVFRKARHAGRVLANDLGTRARDCTIGLSSSVSVYP